MTNFLGDCRQAARGLLRSPSLLFIGVLSLGLGIGVNLTLFSGISAVFLNEPTIADPDAVVGVEPGNSNQFSYLNYRDLKDSHIYEQVVGYRHTEVSLRSGDDTFLVSGLAVSGNFFDGLGVRAQLGRTFTDAEAMPEQQSRLAVLSHSYWGGHFQSDPTVIGRVLNLNGQPFTILGVLPSNHHAVTPLAAPDLYVPLNVLGPLNLNERTNSNGLTVIARLKPGSSLAQVETETTAFGRQLENTYPTENVGMSRPAKVFPSSALRLRGIPALMIGVALSTLFGLVLLVACANVAGLLMVRGANRRQEIAIRLALGASRRRVIQSLLVESLLLSIVGGTLALLFVVWLTPLLSTLSLPGQAPVQLELHPDFRFVAYAAFMTTLTALVCGIVPALQSTGAALVSDIQKGNSRTATGQLRLRHAFVVGQVAISLLLLVVSSLFLRSLLRASSADPGFDVDHGVVIKVPASTLGTDQQLEQSGRIVERLQLMSNVRAASPAMTVPLGNDLRAERFDVVGHPERRARTFVNSVGTHYFETMGIPLLRGREFQSSDKAGTLPVVVVSESFARAYFPGEEALGKSLGTPKPDFVRSATPLETATIIGIAKDHSYRNRGEAAGPVLYRAYAQTPNMSSQPRPLIIHLRTEQVAADSIGAIRRAMSELDPNAAANVELLSNAIGSEIALRQIASTLLSSAGGLGLLLAMIGLYGVMAYVVTSGSAEMAIRMALGASSERVLWGILKRGLTLVGAGIAIGSVLAFAATRPLAFLLAGLSPNDPVTFIGTATILTVVGLIASYVPARRATRLNPAAVLRQQ